VSDGRVDGHGPDGGADGIQIAVGGIGRRMSLGARGQNESGEQEDAGEKAMDGHDYRVCPGMATAGHP